MNQLMAAVGLACLGASAIGHSAEPSPTPTSLQQLMPADVSASGCTDKTASTKASLAGLQTRLLCVTNDASGIQLDAFQFDSAEHYKAGLQTINLAVNYNDSQATPDCPPAANTQGKLDVNPAYAKRPGQYIECFYNIRDGSYNYLYTMPTNNTLMWAFTASGWPALENWWKRYGAPSASPTTGR